MSPHSHPIFEIPRLVRTRQASPENWSGAKGGAARAGGGRKGSPCFRLPAGESRVLAEVSGASGTVRRIWCTIADRSFPMLRGLRLDMYWDNAPSPAVSAPLGDFFGLGLGRMAAFQSVFFSSPEARSFNCFIPMPFRTGMKIVVTNETATDQPAFYYDISYTIGDGHGADAGYLHAHWRRENPTQIGRDYEFLPCVTGRGRYLGANVGVIADTSTYFRTWWGEGECKVYLDGDEQHPTLCGTGTEDYIGAGWGMGECVQPYQGCTIADRRDMEYAFFRYHVPDPIYFDTSIRVTMQQIGCWCPEDIELLRNARRALIGVPLLVLTLVVAAEHDYTPVELKEAYAKRMPDARVAVIAGAHHATPVEKPAEFNAVLKEFLS